MDLTADQQRYLQTIFDYFHANAEWPTRRFLERELLKADLDAREIARTLAGRAGDPPYVVSWDPTTQAILTVPDMTHCRGSEAELDAFIQALRLCAKRYLAEDQPSLSNLDLITGLHVDDAMARKVGLMFHAEPSLFTSYSTNSMGWTMGVSNEMYRFRKVQTLEDYLAARWKAVPTSGETFFQSVSSATQATATNSASPVVASREVFVVHGHDEAAREATARFIEHLGLSAIVLHEQANAGRTIIEKFEKYSQVAFAVVLLTPDDIGTSRQTPDELRSRARQNVILELGYFLGKLGRNRVCALYREDVELPSDLHGVLYVQMDRHDGWKLDLAKEIREAGIEIKNII